MSDEELSGEADAIVEEEEIEEEEISGSKESGDHASEEKSKGKRLTPAEWAEARELYELGKTGLVALSNKFGISRQAMSKWFKNNGVTFGSRAHELQQSVNQGVRGAAQNAAERYSEVRERWIEETRINGYNDLKNASLIAKKALADAIKAGRSLATLDDDFKAAQRYVKIMRDSIDGRLRILDADNQVAEEDLPKLIVDDLTAEKLREFHQNNGVEDEDELDEILKNFEKDPEP